MAFFDLSRTTIADWNKLGTFLTWTTRCWLACYRSAEPSLRNRGEIATESADDPLGEGAIVSAVARGLALRAGARRFGRGFAVLCAKCKSAMVFGTAALYLCYLLLAATTGHAQSPPPDPISTATAAPVAGLVPPYEINKIVRAAGFSPLAPPRREGATYVLRAIDYREILMRIVVDARSGAIQAVNRMVPAKPNGVVGAMPPAFGGRGTYDSLSSLPPNGPLPGLPPYEPPPRQLPSGPQPHDVPPDHAMPADTGGSPAGAEQEDLSTPPPPPLMTHSSTQPAPQGAQPLPRPRPSELTMQKAKPAGKVPKAPVVKSSAAPAAASVSPAVPYHSPKTAKKPSQIATPN